MNQVREQQKIFFIGLMLNYLVVAAGILLGAGIFSLVLGQIVLGLVPRWQARARVFHFLAGGTRVAPQTIFWRTLWPSTWRFYLTGVCTYFSLPFTTLICAQVTTLQITASFGFSLQLLLTLHTIASCWQMVKLPSFSALRVAGRIDEIRREFIWRALLGMGTFVFGAVIIMSMESLFMTTIGSKTPLLPYPALQLMCLLVGLDCLIGLHAAVIQTTNLSPHLPGFIAGAVLGILLGYWLGKKFGAAGILEGGIIGQLCFSLWWTLAVCWKDLVRKPRLSSPAYR
jgi:hypothetical protein